jgi:hypothetical protein
MSGEGGNEHLLCTAHYMAGGSRVFEWRGNTFSDHYPSFVPSSTILVGKVEAEQWGDQTALPL